MGTRGSITFVANGTEKTVYNHFDSYPDHLGSNILGALRLRVADNTLPGLKAQIVQLVEVGEDTPITPAHVKALAEFTDVNVGNGTNEPDLWYKLLRNTQGDIDAILRAGYFESAAHFPADSLFCEWGYVIDTDEEKFEVYRGFQREPHTEGRFHSLAVSGEYHPIRLVASYGFDELPDDAEWAGLETKIHIDKAGGLVSATRELVGAVDDSLEPFVDHLLSHIVDGETDIEDAKAALEHYDIGEAADHVSENIIETAHMDEDYWAEQALSEFGFEGCGESMSGIRDMARYVYNKTQVSEAQQKIVEALDELA